MTSGMTKQDTAVLKGMAVIMMVFHHCFRTTGIFDGYDISFFPLSQGVVVNLCSAFKMCVDIFVFISGYGLTLSVKKLRQDCALSGPELSRWYIGRYFRLMAGFWFIYIGYALLGQLATHRFTATFTATYFGKGMWRGGVLALLDFLGLSNLMGTPILGGGWWYMSCAVVLVLLVPLFARLTCRFGGVCALAALFILPRALCIEYPMYDCAYHFLFMAMLGVVFAQYDLMGRWKRWRLCQNAALNTLLQVVGMLLVVAVCYKLNQRVSVETFWEIKHGLFPLAVILFAVKFLSPLPGLSQVLQFFGKYSMDIYLVHLLIRAHFKRPIFSLGHFVAVGGTLLLVSLVLALVIEWVKKSIRYQKGIDALTQRAYQLLQGKDSEKQTIRS